jgi:hypothetical protein
MLHDKHLTNNKYNSTLIEQNATPVMQIAGASENNKKKNKKQNYSLSSISSNSSVSSSPPSHPSSFMVFPFKPEDEDVVPTLVLHNEQEQREEREEREEREKQGISKPNFIDNADPVSKCSSDKSTQTNPVDILKYFLDPFSVIIKLAILSKKPIGTKLCIYNNNLCIQERGVFQSVVRYTFNNTKNELHYLYNPIEFACRAFLHSANSSVGINVRIIFQLAQKGLQLLIEHYKQYNMIVHTLYMYFNIIENHLGDTYNDKLFIKDSNTHIYETDIVENLNSKWTHEKIYMVLNMVEFVDNDNSKKSVKCLSEFMFEIDNENRLFIEKFIATYNKNKTDETTTMTTTMTTTTIVTAKPEI